MSTIQRERTVAVPFQQRLRINTTLLCHTFIACLVLRQGIDEVNTSANLLVCLSALKRHNYQILRLIVSQTPLLADPSGFEK
jgi:hypothetical protein